jgi:hypothetical protein
MAGATATAEGAPAIDPRQDRAGPDELAMRGEKLERNDNMANHRQKW